MNCINIENNKRTKTALNLDFVVFL